MTKRQAPPGRTSISNVVMVKPFGPHHSPRYSRFVNASKTSARGASKTRVATIARPSAAAFGCWSAGMFLLLLLLQCAQESFEAVETLLPEFAVVLDPLSDVLERRGLETARPPLRLASTGDESRALEHFQMLRDRRETHLERPRQFENRCFARGKPRQDGPTRRIGERGERGVEIHSI